MMAVSRALAIRFATTALRQFAASSAAVRSEAICTVAAARAFHTTSQWWRGGDEEASVDKADILPLPQYSPRVGEDVKTKRARLLYQSRKRGMLENGLLLSTFAAEHLYKLTSEQLTLYDHLINQPSNDWQLYYWITGREEPPSEYDNEVLSMLQEHVCNPNREKRHFQPELKFTGTSL